MLLDNRNILPPGVRRAKTAAGEDALAMWLTLPGGERLLTGSVSPDFFQKNTAEGAVLLDFLEKEPPDVPPPSYLKHFLTDMANRNHEVHLEAAAAGKFEYEQSDVVLIVGGGPSVRGMAREIENHRGKATVLTLSRSLPIVPGDYFVSLDPQPVMMDLVRGADFSKTIAHLVTTTATGLHCLPWKDVTWGALSFLYGRDNIPRYFPHENVSCIALEFAIKTLGAKKVVMVGMEHPVSAGGHMAYFFHGIELQSMAWFAARHGVEVWNCTPDTTVVSSVILGSLQEAFERTPGEIPAM